MNLNSLCQKAVGTVPLSDAEIRFLIDLPDDRLGELLECAHAIRLAHFSKTVSLCAIINAKSGTCSEDCAFCAQSGHHGANSPEYPLLPVGEIVKAGKRAAANGVSRFGVVASGKLVGDSDLAGYADAVRALSVMGIVPDLSPGILDRAQLTYLQRAGLGGYHHNLETSASFFPSICTTHAYEEDVRAVRAALQAGLYVCSGGIFGIGESWDDRVELALLLRDLGVPSVPINFLHPVAGTPMANRAVLTPEEALKIVAVYRFLLPDRALRICGGRPTVFGEERKGELLAAGTSGLMVGNYLTTTGGRVDTDIQDITQNGLTLEASSVI